MKFVAQGKEAAAQALYTCLSSELQLGRHVLWLVCGGSNIPTEAEVMRQLSEHHAAALDNLTILPMDERYGPVGHSDSNYHQLQEAGFKPGGALWMDVLAKNMPLGDTVAYYEDLFANAAAVADTIVGTFGLGTDGHTAGVLPHSPAVADSISSVVGYDSPPFVRMTLTPQELARTQHAYVLAYGESKREPLTRLQAHTEPLEALPAGLLYDIPDTHIYSDALPTTAEHKEH